MLDLNKDESDCFFSHYIPEKRNTHLPLYVNDMFKYLKGDEGNYSLLEDRAYGSLFLFPAGCVNYSIENSPLARGTRAERISFDYYSFTSKNTPPIYSDAIMLLLTIVRLATDDILEPRMTACNHRYLLTAVEDLKRWVDENIEPPQEEVFVPQKPVQLAKWFKQLCDHCEVDEFASLRSVWNQIKMKSSPDAPMQFGEFQVVIDGDRLFYSSMPMCEGEWAKYFLSRRAQKISYKSFGTYLSDYRKIKKSPECWEVVDL
ncbi:MAG: hypothetical protein ACNI27_15270 [Desulfovibrio sp.]